MLFSSFSSFLLFYKERVYVERKAIANKEYYGWLSRVFSDKVGKAKKRRIEFNNTTESTYGTDAQCRAQLSWVGIGNTMIFIEN